MAKNQNLDTKNKHTIAHKISNVTKAGLGKRLLANIMDALIFVFVALILYMFVFTPIAKAGMNYEGNQVLGQQYQVYSHLYVYQQVDDNYNYNVIEVKDYSEKINASKEGRVTPIYQIERNDYKWYIEHIYYYYTAFLTGDLLKVIPEMPNNTELKTYDPYTDHFICPNYNKYVTNTNLYPIEYYTDDWISENVLKLNSQDSYFIRNIDPNKPYHEQISMKSTANIEDVVKFLRSTANEATAHFYYSDYFASINNALKWTQIFVVGMSIVISFAIFYVLIPLLYKNGETLAKKFQKLSVISANGYKAKKRQIIFRQIVLFVELALPSCVVGIGLTSLAILGLMIVILFVATIISKTNRSLHDYAGYTIVVDAPKSVWFDNPEDEEKATKELDDKMSQYKNKNIIDSHVIQVGDQIIKDEFKIEKEEENQKIEK